MKGFTLIELLVVIAIIGFISTIAMVNFNSARTKARVATVYGSFVNIRSGLRLCLDSSGVMVHDGADACINIGGIPSPTKIPKANMTFCAPSASFGSIGKWPTLPSGWGYTFCAQDFAKGKFQYAAAGPSCIIACDEIRCTRSAGCPKF